MIGMLFLQFMKRSIKLQYSSFKSFFCVLGVASRLYWSVNPGIAKIERGVF